MINLDQKTKLPSRLKWYFLTKVSLPVILVSLPLLFVSVKFWWSILSSFFLFVELPVGIALILYISSVSFTINKNRVTTSFGIFTRRTKSTSFTSMDSLHFVAGMLMRSFGLTKIMIGSEKYPTESLYLNKDDAEWLKELVLSKAK